MKKNTSILIPIMHVISWLAFVGASIKAGAILTSYLVSIFGNKIASENMYLSLNLSQLMNQDMVAYSILSILIIGVLVMEALLCYQVIRIFLKIDFSKPFQIQVEKIIMNMSVIALFVGILCKLSSGFAKRYTDEGMSFPHLNEHIGVGDAFLYFAGILFVIDIVFRKGIELQTENDLTV